MHLELQEQLVVVAQHPLAQVGKDFEVVGNVGAGVEPVVAANLLRKAPSSSAWLRSR